MKRTGLNIIWSLLLAGGMFSCTATPKQTEEIKWSERMARSEMQRFPETWMIEKAKKPRWGYTYGLVVKSMLEEWKHTGDTAYYTYAKIYADSLIDPDGKIKTMKYLSFNLDNINSGKIQFDFYARTGEERYRTAMDTLRKQLTEQPRTGEGGYWHKLIYPHQMWLDGIFMTSPFLAQYGETFGDTTVYADIVNQITLIARKTYDPKTGLYYHGWDESKEQAWANQETGCSPNFWSRSIGWYAAAVVDVLDYMPQQFNGRDSILAIINTLAQGIVKYQEPETGVWWQVTDQNNRKGNYLESSASSLFVYFLCKAVNKGYIPAEYQAAAQRGFNGLIKTFIKEEPDGSYIITNCCAVAGLGGKGNRDGSFAYYVGEPVIENDPKSVGAFILAAIEYEKLTSQNNENE
ncbi:MAG: glycoside hydrolase family 88 protein [Bacteroides sp.]|nr:glycoside hydrolase family 88 protein [Bacteroides sp.]